MVAIIVATSVFFGIYLNRPGFPVTRSLLIVLLFLETSLLLWYLTRIRRDLLKLVNALRNEDPTLQFSRKGKDPYFSAIHRGFNEIIRDFRLVRLDKEAEHRFLLVLVEHIQFGILAHEENGNIKIVNESFLTLFGLQDLSDINQLKDVSPGLPEMIRDLSPLQESLKQVRIRGEIRHLIFLNSRFRLRDQEISLVSVRDISREIDRNELEAWQKLLRILRHEILNSLSPIRIISHNLSDTLRAGRKEKSFVDLPEKQAEEVRTGLETIHRRASGLSNFLDAYANLYRIPDLHLTPVKVEGLLHSVYSLFKEQFRDREEKEIMKCRTPGMVIMMDERLIEQVLINLLKNSVQATAGMSEPSISIVAEMMENEAVISVIDNGEGIPDDQLENIFVPFYSTKKEGTGIGLSFSQHVMRLHNGQMKVYSRAGSGSEFRLLFPVR